MLDKLLVTVLVNPTTLVPAGEPPMTDGVQKEIGARISDAFQSIPQIIQAVTSVLGLSALAILAIVIVVWATPEGASISSYLLRLGGVVAVYLIAIVYIYRTERTELTFKVRVARLENGVEAPWDGAPVDLLKNGKSVQVLRTDEDGFVFLTIQVGRGDELSVIVLDPVTNQPKSEKAALYAKGQCMVPKKILLAS